MSAIAVLAATSQPPLRICDAADFDGTNDYLARGGPLTGAFDSKVGVFSCWIRLDGGDGVEQEIFNGTVAIGQNPVRGMVIVRNQNNNLLFLGASSDPVTGVQWGSTQTMIAGASWHHILASWDTATSTFQLYVDDVEWTPNGSVIFNDVLLDWTNGENMVGAAGETTFKLNGALAELYLSINKRLDLSKVAIRRRFRSPNGKPVSLGDNGILPTGSIPLVYLKLNNGQTVSEFGTLNHGIGGGFAVGGSLDTASTSPSD